MNLTEDLIDAYLADGYLQIPGVFTPDEMAIPSTLGEERATNPFLRAQDAAELGRIRTLKDNF